MRSAGRRFLCVVVLAVALSLGWGVAAPPAVASAPVQTYTHWTYDEVRADIWQAASEFGVSYPYLLALAQCESGLNPQAYNPSGAIGLFQFLPATFWTYAPRLAWSSTAWVSPWDPRASARTAAAMISWGLARQWTCSSRI